MQSSGSSSAPEAILEWLQKEMGYRPQRTYLSSNKLLSSVESLRKICRVNMLPVWDFMLQRVKLEKTVEKIWRNILVHGNGGGGIVSADAAAEEGRGKGRRKERGKPKLGFEKGLVGLEDLSSKSRESTLSEREAAQREVMRLRHLVQRQRKELRAKMLEVSREEVERKRKLDEKSNCR